MRDSTRGWVSLRNRIVFSVISHSLKEQKSSRHSSMCAFENSLFWNLPFTMSQLRKTVPRK